MSGTGDDFCSGFDLGQRGKGDGTPRAGATQRRMRWQVNRLIPTMLETQTPIVTAAKGWIIGLGLHLVLASDFAVVADDARLRAPFTDDGVHARLAEGRGSSPGSSASPRAKEMLMLGHEVTGAQAASWGMVHRAAPAADVDPAAQELVDELASAATVAVGLTKLLIHRGLRVDLERHLADEALAIELSSRSDDFHEYSRARPREARPEVRGPLTSAAVSGITNDLGYATD